MLLCCRNHSVWNQTQCIFQMIMISCYIYKYILSLWCLKLIMCTCWKKLTRCILPTSITHQVKLCSFAGFREKALDGWELYMPLHCGNRYLWNHRDSMIFQMMLSDIVHLCLCWWLCFLSTDTLWLDFLWWCIELGYTQSNTLPWKPNWALFCHCVWGWWLCYWHCEDVG